MAAAAAVSYKQEIITDFSLLNEPCCCPDSNPLLNQSNRRVVVRIEPGRLVLTDEKISNPSFLRQLFCCYPCCPPPSSALAIDTYKQYLAEKTAQNQRNRMGVRISKLDLDAMQENGEPLLVRHLELVVDSIGAWKKMEIVIHNCKTHLLMQRPAPTRPPHPFAIGEEPPKIVVNTGQASGKAKTFSEEILLKSLDTLQFEQELSATKKKAVVEGVKQSLYTTLVAREGKIVVAIENLSAFVASILSAHGHVVKPPALFDAVARQSRPQMFMHPTEDDLFKLYELYEQVKARAPHLPPSPAIVPIPPAAGAAFAPMFPPSPALAPLPAAGAGPAVDRKQDA